MKDTEQKDRGSLLVEDLEMISDRTQRIERNEMEQTAWDVADLLKDVDYFKFVEYMKCMDDPGDPVRRLYMDLKIQEKRAALADYLLKFTDTAYTEKIRKVAAKLKDMDRDREASLTAGKKETHHRR